ncbi:ABC transporter permease [Caproiciproducens galactitolivorans]|uniref:Branched-chain amino acid transport system / permease component n=1 Tax=Caproiciproducens galactitolivorans TaxID=642589 RepID=A0A4Z0YI22_9FIRM|nr:ABC transporter permease [Caproiciproducens galactitolivorans]QEY35550.1 ABC transporter permease [Caproiciproducens galactitolivorans]TGJ77276.1 branched-chain amino acid transport system / permease component [Caproiciproducens galactitolivorans]
MKNKQSYSSKTIENRFEIFRVIVAIGISLLVALLLIMFASKQPLNALKWFLAGPIMTMRNFGNVLELFIPLTFGGLSIAVMFQCNQFNMAAEGSFFLGGLGAAMIAVGVKMPSVIHAVVALLAGALFGVVLCLIPAILKVKWKANEVVSSLMLNYIALFFGSYILQYMLMDPDAGYIASHSFPKSARLAVIIPKTGVHMGIFIAIVMVVLTYLFLYRTKWGYAIRITGQNENFAKYSGIGVGSTIILSQIAGGALAGMGGATQVLGMYTRFSWVSLPGYGFDGIIISILAKNNPKFIPLAAFFLAYLRVGADIMSRRSDVAPEVVSIIQAIIVVLIAGKMFLDTYKHKMIVKNSQRQVKEEA